MDIDSSPAVGVNGKVFVGTKGNLLYAFNSDGTLLWSYTGGDWFVSSPSIGAPGRIYVGSVDNNIYTLGW
jgi:outer membrane protein assembly factor BamB